MIWGAAASCAASCLCCVSSAFFSYWTCDLLNGTGIPMWLRPARPAPLGKQTDVLLLSPLLVSLQALLSVSRGKKNSSPPGCTYKNKLFVIVTKSRVVVVTLCGIQFPRTSKLSAATQSKNIHLLISVWVLLYPSPFICTFRYAQSSILSPRSPFRASAAASPLFPPQQ